MSLLAVAKFGRRCDEIQAGITPAIGSPASSRKHTSVGLDSRRFRCTLSYRPPVSWIRRPTGGRGLPCPCYDFREVARFGQCGPAGLGGRSGRSSHKQLSSGPLLPGRDSRWGWQMVTGHHPILRIAYPIGFPLSSVQ